jgi:hypothetical protein
VDPSAGLDVAGENISCLCQESNPSSSIVQPVAQSLTRLRYPVSVYVDVKFCTLSVFTAYCCRGFM